MSSSQVAASAEITTLLAAIRDGNSEAADRLGPLIYAELHAIATRLMRGERPDHTLQPTELVGEAYVRLVGVGNHAWQDRLHFYRTAARAMRRILVDHARRRNAARRGGGTVQLELDEAISAEPASRVDVPALDRALDALAAVAPRQAQVVELRAFAGMEVTDVAEALVISPATVKRDWQFARAWLARALQEEAGAE